jgi:single-strand DNA-binding protein
MRCVNHVTLLGNVGQEPKILSTSSGTLIANISLATSYRKKDSKEDVTEWHRLIAFRRTAEIIRDYVVKGSKLYIEGQLQTRKWDDSGTTRYSTEIVIRDLSLLDNKAAGASQSKALNGTTNDSANAEITDDDIPF